MSPASVTITQLEPVVYLRGQSASGEDARGRRRPVNIDAPPSQLRGLVSVYLPKPCKIREITVSLTGTARTDWPEGIGPNRLELVEEVTIFKQAVTLFDAKVEGSLPGRRKSNSVGPGIGLNDEVDWDLAAANASSVNSRSTGATAAPLPFREEERSSGNLARQLAEAAARAGTAIIPPTLRPEVSIAKQKDAAAGKAARPNFKRTGSGVTSWSQQGSSLDPTARSPPAETSNSRFLPSAGRERDDALDDSPAAPVGRGGGSAGAAPRSFAGTPTADGGKLRQTAPSALRWSYFSDPSSQEQPPGYLPRSAPLFGYDSWPSNTTLDQAPIETPSSNAGCPVESPTLADGGNNSTSVLSARVLPQCHSQTSSTAPSSPTMSRSPSNVPSKSILNHQPASLARAKDQTVRFDKAPLASTGPSAAPLASSGGVPAAAAATAPSIVSAPGSQSVGSPSRSNPASRRSSLEVSEREKGPFKQKAGTKTSSDLTKGKKSGIKGLIGGLLKEHDTKLEDDAGAAAESKEFKKGNYTFPICISLPSNLPPTLHADFGFNKYVLKASVNRAGALTPNLAAEKEIKLIHAPDEDALDETDSIVVERSWEDVLSYMIVFSGKSFPFGRKIPLWMKFVPQGKVRIHRITATLEERTDYFAKGRRVARHEVPRKWTLLKVANEGSNEPLLPIMSDSAEALEQSALAAMAQAAAGDDPESDDALPSIMDPHGPWELAADLDLPNWAVTRINLSTNHAKSNIAVHHLIRVSIRVEKPGGFDRSSPPRSGGDDKKHQLYDIIIEAPITLTSLHTADEWMNLPNYWSLSSADAVPAAVIDTAQESMPAARALARPPGVARAIPRPSLPTSVVSGRGVAGPPPTSASSSGSSSSSSLRSQPPRERDSGVPASTPLRLSQRWLALSSSGGDATSRRTADGAMIPTTPVPAVGRRPGAVNEVASSSSSSLVGRSRDLPPPAYEPNARQGERVVASSRLMPSSTLPASDGRAAPPPHGQQRTMVAEH